MLAVEITIIVILGLWLYISLKNQINGSSQRLDKRIEKLDNKLDNLRAEMNGKFKEQNEEIKAMNLRVDKLYDLLLDLYRNLFNKAA